LRKVKTLGPQRVTQLLKPGDYMAPLTKVSSIEGSLDESANEAESMPTAMIGLPAYERLILWRNPEDEEHVIEVGLQYPIRNDFGGYL
jgi:hypothetical protein